MDTASLDTKGSLKGFLVQMIVRWIFKVVGGYFAIHFGVLLFTNPSAEVIDAVVGIVGGVLAIGIGIIQSIASHNKAMATVTEVVGNKLTVVTPAQ
jgi:predicted Zn-dependent protease